MERDLKSRHNWLQYMLLQKVLNRVAFNTGEHIEFFFNNAIGTSIAYASLLTHVSIVGIVAGHQSAQIFTGAYKCQLNSVKYYNWRIQTIMVTRRHIHTDCFAMVKGALYIIQILCRRYTFWSYPTGITIADPPG